MILLSGFKHTFKIPEWTNKCIIVCLLELLLLFVKGALLDVLLESIVRDTTKPAVFIFEHDITVYSIFKKIL